STKSKTKKSILSDMNKKMVVLVKGKVRENINVINNDVIAEKRHYNKIVKQGVKIIVDESLDEKLSTDYENVCVRKIYHISDIHISRFDDRHNEYMIVFKRLADEIKKDPDDAI